MFNILFVVEIVVDKLSDEYIFFFCFLVVKRKGVF